MMTSEIISLISSVGFPIVVAWYLLTKMTKTIESNTKSNNAVLESNRALTRQIETNTKANQAVMDRINMTNGLIEKICNKLDIVR